MSAVRAYEASLSLEFLRTLKACGATIYGISDEQSLGGRVPTFCFNLPGIPAATVTEALSRDGIGVRDGHMYSPRLIRRLGLSEESGVVRASLVHYNTVNEIKRLRESLLKLSRHA
jgi:selenocysteine lyase/cysteine desulfurase